MSRKVYNVTKSMPNITLNIDMLKCNSGRIKLVATLLHSNQFVDVYFKLVSPSYDSTESSRTSSLTGNL